MRVLVQLAAAALFSFFGIFTANACQPTRYASNLASFILASDTNQAEQSDQISASTIDTLQAVKERGELIAGVKADYEPFGFKDSNGKLVGLEPDMAAMIAEALGVSLKLVAVTAANRFELLRSREIDVVIATVCDLPSRRLLVGMVEPHYHAAATNILTKKSSGLSSWEDLRGVSVCGVKGSQYNDLPIENSAVMRLYPNDSAALQGLLAGDCLAFAYEDGYIQAKLKSNVSPWTEYVMPLEPKDEQLWSVAVRLEDLNGPFGEQVSNLIKRWHGKGVLIQEETRWAIPHRTFMDRMTAEYAQLK